ncbi:MAG: hypothetical protein Q8K32_11240 [Archangium sp.]|nr:hypothetical protein [Archangium sp.]
MIGLCLALVTSASPGLEPGSIITLPPHVGVVLSSSEPIELGQDKGAQGLDTIEDRLVKDSSFSSEQERCEVRRLLFRDFAGAAGTWTAERAARLAAQCSGN